MAKEIAKEEPKKAEEAKPEVKAEVKPVVVPKPEAKKEVKAVDAGKGEEKMEIKEAPKVMAVEPHEARLYGDKKAHDWFNRRDPN